MFVLALLISRDINSSSSVRQREVSVRDPYSAREEFPRRRQHWRITWGMEAKKQRVCLLAPVFLLALSLSRALFRSLSLIFLSQPLLLRCILPFLETVDLDKIKCCCCAVYRSEYSICNFSSICPPFPFPPAVTVSLWTSVASHLSSCVLSFPTVTCFFTFCLAPLSPLFFSRLLPSLLFPSDLPLLPSIITCHSVSLLRLPPLASSFSSFPSAGRRWNPGDQWREHQGHEARESHWAHQKRGPARPSGAQEGWRLCAWIWWVNLRKHSLLPHLHALSQGTPSGRWWVKGGRTILPSQDPSPIPGTHPPGRGRGLVGLGCLSGGGHPLGFGIFLGGRQGWRCTCGCCRPPPSSCCHLLSVSMSSRCHFSPSGHWAKALCWDFTERWWVWLSVLRLKQKLFTGFEWAD